MLNGVKIVKTKRRGMKYKQKLLNLFTTFLFYFLFSQFIITTCIAQYDDSDRNQFRSNNNRYRESKQDPSCCQPPVGDLLIGREKQLFASSTCGLNGTQRYCIFNHLEKRKKCYNCGTVKGNEMNRLAYHGIEKIITKEDEPWKDFWWQAENGVENVYIQLDLEAEFQFTHIIIRFQTFRPAAMIIERSDDFGKTWKPYQYFAANCEESFPTIPKRPRSFLGDVICESKYSGVDPSRYGDLVFSVLPQDIAIKDPYASEVQDLIKITNLRINFTRLHTLGDEKLDKRQEIMQKYYYAIGQMVVRGSCSCYGHASKCIPEPSSDPKQRVANMVYGRCECNHNTMGNNCYKCKDFYNDLPWRPAFGNMTNECRRCNCNNHSTKCRFDNAVYESSGRVSGGVCEDCQHNTEGKNCELCKAFYYQDPRRSIDDPFVCLPCDCDPQGSVEDGQCDSVDNPSQGITAGTCHCKRNVVGKRCDQCKPNFWNMSSENPNGCQACSCDSRGTQKNVGCIPTTGECVCMRNVLGRNCDACAPGSYDLGGSDEGCKSCDCDLGASESNQCDIITGQCSCLRNIEGRRCDQVKAGTFVPLIDYYLLYEAENSEASPDAKVMNREPYPEGTITWTGTGFIKVQTGSTISFDINNIVKPMKYELIFKYEPITKERIEAQIVIKRLDGYPEMGGPCEGEYKNTGTAILSPNDREAKVIGGPFCFEPGKKYQVNVKFSTPNGAPATILIDSLILPPMIDVLKMFQGSEGEKRRQEFDNNQCMIYFMQPKRQAPDICKKYLYSIAVQISNGAHDCNCDPTGSESSICSSVAGACKCKPNVIGRTCNQCAPGFYDFGPEGCKPCECHPYGALDNFCQQTGGQCSCRNTTYFSRQCDECQPGYWNYPNCIKCNCNNHADKCHKKTGVCIDCRDNTAGPDCSSCEAGYYGEPVLGREISCRPCPCPGLPGSNFSYADSCELNEDKSAPRCNCRVGHVGERCNQCANNYYGNPAVPNSPCVKCNCSNNIDFIDIGNCNQKTGECLKCLYNTDGWNCQDCKSGYFGDALQKSCRECVCNELGTDMSNGQCDRVTGQCQCLPNVEGIQCDRCKKNHWNLASKEGCSPCDCDQIGSTSQTCNEIDGRCECLKGYGGRQCNECEADYWGNPSIQCHACDCRNPGCLTTQCHKNNGTCVCREGISGDRCDKCARGYLGNAPYCNSCGECFHNWDKIITTLRDNTLSLLESARKIRETGATGAYKSQFSIMENELLEIEKILAETNLTEAQVSELMELANRLKEALRRVQEELNKLETNMSTTEERTISAQLTLSDLKNRVAQLEARTQALRENATDLQATNVEGAFNLTKDALQRSRNAEEKIRLALEKSFESESLRQDTDRIIDQSGVFQNQTYDQTQANLANIDKRVEQMEENVLQINELVCGARGGVNNCDSNCGGALCNFCGGLSCASGAATTAANALDFAQTTKQLMSEKRADGRNLLARVQETSSKADEALRKAKAIHERIIPFKNDTDKVDRESESLLEKLDQFLNTLSALPGEIRIVAKECLEMKISLSSEEILSLAKEINETIAKLTDIERILKDTESDLMKANTLRRRADDVRQKADSILNSAAQVIETLKTANENQVLAQEAISNAGKHMRKSEEDLMAIRSDIKTTRKESEKAQQLLIELEKQLNELKTRYTQNELYIGKARKEADAAETIANEASIEANGLERKFNSAAAILMKKAKDSSLVKERARDLQERAKQLAEGASSKLKALQEMEDEFDENEKRLNKYDDIIDKLNKEMEIHLADIERKAVHHRTCNK